MIVTVAAANPPALAVAMGIRQHELSKALLMLAPAPADCRAAAVGGYVLIAAPVYAKEERDGRDTDE